ncbi:MAG: biotin--[acetyl-CoA-carboxylase] ligase [Ghiorsea sp.]
MSIHFNIQHFESIDSTNKEAMRQAVESVDEGLVVIADEQSKGKGRLGRKWHTINHSLAMTILLRPDIQAVDVPKMSLLTAVALHEALSNFAPNIGIKWPNDLLINGKKVSGILTEMRCEGSRVKAVILGMGINISKPEQDWPEDITQPAIDLETASGNHIDKNEVLSTILKSIDKWHTCFLAEGFAPIHQAWWKAHVASGKIVRVHDGTTYIEGIAHALADDGALRLLVNGVEQRIIAGDVSLMDK